jgi:hypothetical protein
MANEAVCYERPTRFARYTVSSAAAIAKGTILKLSTPNTAAAASANDDPVGGIAWMEKVASPADGSTEITAALDGTWGILTATTAPITVGNDVVVHSANKIKVYTTLDREKGYVLGKGLETVSSAAGVVMKVRLDL